MRLASAVSIKVIDVSNKVRKGNPHSSSRNSKYDGIGFHWAGNPISHLLKSYYDWDGSSLSGLKFTRGEISREVVWNYSRFDIDDGCDVELNPGDTFFLPAYWWHQVEALPYDDERPWCLSYSQVYRSPFVRSKATSTTRPSTWKKSVSTAS
mmetsp:Transcript_2845/g.2791  ORF Transcript_2845/g.2791 Transcript_2845/m.2791 type:complete len:152 (+) Transcript_2845:3-458(+)